MIGIESVFTLQAFQSIKSIMHTSFYHINSLSNNNSLPRHAMVLEIDYWLCFSIFFQNFIKINFLSKFYVKMRPFFWFYDVKLSFWANCKSRFCFFRSICQLLGQNFIKSRFLVKNQCQNVSKFWFIGQNCLAFKSKCLKSHFF